MVNKQPDFYAEERRFTCEVIWLAASGGHGLGDSA